MPQFLILNGGIECLGCGAILKKVSEQDRRVAIMKHDGEISCNLCKNTFRIDRQTGYGEAIYDA